MYDFSETLKILIWSSGSSIEHNCFNVWICSGNSLAFDAEESTIKITEALWNSSTFTFDNPKIATPANSRIAPTKNIILNSPLPFFLSLIIITYHKFSKCVIIYLVEVYKLINYQLIYFNTNFLRKISF